MKNEDIFICYLNPLTSEEVSLIGEFWLLTEDWSTYAYKYQLPELSEKYYLDRGEILTFIKENCFVTTRNDTHNCEGCGCKLEARTRTRLNEIFNKNKKRLCGLCKKEEKRRVEAETKRLEAEKERENKRLEEEYQKRAVEVNKLAEQKIEKLISKPIKLNLPIFEFEKSKLENLSYADKLALLCLMIDVKLEKNQPLHLSKEELNLSGDIDVDVSILETLLSKGAIYVLESRAKLPNDLLVDTENFISQNRWLLNSTVVEKYSRFLANLPKPGLYILLSSCFETMQDYKSWLFDELTNAKVGDAEIKEIEELVIANRLSQAYLLVQPISEEFNIPVQFNIKLETVLMSLVRHYPLTKAYGIMRYQAKQVASKLHSNPEMPFFYQNKLFAKYIETYMRHLKENEKSPYPNRLPDFIYGSKLEHFSSYYLMGELTSWDDLSANEIIARWIEHSSK